MPATAIRQTEPTDIDCWTPVDDRRSDREYGVLLYQPPPDMDGQIPVRVEGIYHEPGDGINGFLAAEVQHHQVLMKGRAPLDLFFRQFG